MYAALFGLGSAVLDEDLRALEVMKYMAWSWADFCAAPAWLLDAIIVRMNEEAKAKNHGDRG